MSLLRKRKAKDSLNNKQQQQQPNKKSRGNKGKKENKNSLSPPSKRIIAYSLFEDPNTHPDDLHLYRTGVLRNLARAQEHFPDWTVRIYYDDSVSLIFLDFFKTLVGIEWVYVKHSQELGSLVMTFARFLASSDPDAEVVLFRDLDNELRDEDAEIIKQWLARTQACHRYVIPNYHRNMVACGIAVRPALYRARYGGEDFFSQEDFERVQREDKESGLWDGFAYGCEEKFLDLNRYPDLKHDKQIYSTHIRPLYKRDTNTNDNTNAKTHTKTKAKVRDITTCSDNVLPPIEDSSKSIEGAFMKYLETL